VVAILGLQLYNIKSNLSKRLKDVPGEDGAYFKFPVIRFNFNGKVTGNPRQEVRMLRKGRLILRGHY